MSEADLLLEELGFRREDDGRYPTYLRHNQTLMFDVDDKNWGFHAYINSSNRNEARQVSISLNYAITLKMKELGWI